MRKTSDPGTAATVICPPGADNCPVLTTVPPSKAKFCPGITAKLPALTILPGTAAPKEKAFGVPTKALKLFVPATLNQLEPKPTPFAVVAVKAAGTFKLAFGPNTIPAGRSEE